MPVAKKWNVIYKCVCVCVCVCVCDFYFACLCLRHRTIFVEKSTSIKVHRRVTDPLKYTVGLPIHLKKKSLKKIKV